MAGSLYMCDSFKMIPAVTPFLDKYKMVPTFMLHFLQNMPLVQVHNSSSDCKRVGNIPEGHFVKNTSACPSHSWCQYRHKSVVPSILISVEGTGKNRLESGHESMGEATVSLHCYLVRNPWPKSAGVLEHCREGETNCWFSIFRELPSDRLPKAMEVVIAYCYIHSFTSCSNSSKLYQRIPGTFWRHYLSVLF